MYVDEDVRTDRLELYLSAQNVCNISGGTPKSLFCSTYLHEGGKAEILQFVTTKEC